MNLGMNWYQLVKNDYITIFNIVYTWEKKGMLLFSYLPLHFLHFPFPPILYFYQLV